MTQSRLLKPGISLFLALRYLKPKRTFLSLITVISVLGVTLGITVLILVISVMTGFERELEQKVIGFDANVVVTNNALMQDWRGLQRIVDAKPHVVASAPFVMGPVIAEFEHRRLTPKVRGIDPDLESKVTDLGKFVIEGDLDLSGDTCVVGSELATALGLNVGDTLTIYSPGNLDALMDELNRMEKDGAKPEELRQLRNMVLPMELTVTGIFRSGRYIYDAEFILVPLHIGQELYALGDDVHGLSVRCDDPYRAGDVKLAIAAEVGETLNVLTWIDLNRQIFEAIRTERNVMFFLLIFIVIVAAFGIMNTLITTTVQKTREIGILKALGARTGQIIGVFLAQGVVVGIFGTITGLALGMTLVQYRNEFRQWLADTFRIEVFPASIYQFSAIPAEVVPSDVAIICVSAFLICAVAALIPAWFAARLDPVKALRYE